MRGVAETQIGMFKADMLTIQSQVAANGANSLQTTDPLALRLVS